MNGSIFVSVFPFSFPNHTHTEFLPVMRTTIVPVSGCTFHSSQLFTLLFVRSNPEAEAFATEKITVLCTIHYGEGKTGEKNIALQMNNGRYFLARWLASKFRFFDAGSFPLLFFISACANANDSYRSELLSFQKYNFDRFENQYRPRARAILASFFPLLVSCNLPWRSG